MLFNSFSFIFVFLPAVWLLHAAARMVMPAGANAVLALASLGFYGWWDIRFLPLLIGSIAANFLFGRRIAAAVAAGRAGAARLWTTAGIVANLALLGVFKYADFFIETAAALGGAPLSALGLILPIGISFFTFQQIAYLMDVRAGQSERYGIVDYTLFVSFFPQLIAGPIVHHREMMPQFARARGPQAHDIALGLALFVAGLFKKVVIADHLAGFASPVFALADAGGGVSSAEAWGAALAYSFQIYFDFSGYSDMAIGLGRMFGIRLPINFDSPYKAGSIIEFWRRWHMTLSRFLRDYLYIPLGGNRKGPARRHVNLFLTMLLGGFWHGAGWGFVIWGALHGLYLGLDHAIRAVAGPARSRWRRGLGWTATFAGVVLAWVFFRATTLDGALTMLDAMLGIGGLTLPADYADNLGGLPARFGIDYAHDSAIALRDWALAGVPLIAAAAAIAFLAPNTNRIFLAGDAFYATGQGEAPVPPRPGRLAWRPGPAQAALVLLVFAVAVLHAGTISEFLYFQF